MDVFGRARHAKFRDDMQGLGSFMKETRTLCVADFILPLGEDVTTVLYETLWRFFSAFGEVEDLNLVLGKSMAFIRYKHRCMAELAKEALQNRNLDGDDILTIRWAHDDPAPESIKRKQIEDKNKITSALERKTAA